MARDNRPIPQPLPDDYLFPVPRCVRDTAKSKEPTSLPKAVQQFIHAIVYGINLDFKSYQGVLKPGTPLSSRQAAWAMGFSQERTEHWMRTRIFKSTLREMVNERRFAEEPENLAAAITIRDYVGNNSPDDRRVRLQAIGVIRPKEPASAAVNINLQQNNATVNQISPGYVIRLKEPKDSSS